MDQTDLNFSSHIAPIDTKLLDLEKAIKERRSVRKFLPKPVPRPVLMECLTLARLAPSNSNIQPWRLFFAEGARRDKLRAALLTVASTETPNIPALPKDFQRFRQELGVIVYGSMGIRREDREARAAAVLRNFEFFGAPTVGIVCMHRDLGPADSLGVGMFLQNLILCLTARGLGSCAQVSLAGYPDIVREQLKIPEELTIICGLSIGYADPAFPANNLRIPREPLENNVTFIVD